MDGTARILRRFVGATIITSVALLIVNFIILGVWIFGGMNGSHSPGQVVRNVAEGLRYNGSYTLDKEAGKLLRQNNAWAMLLDRDGRAVWSFDMPDEVPRSYSLADVAKFSRHYLQNYPVTVWERDGGLVVVGFPQDSVAKYQFSFPVEWVSGLPFRSAVLVAGNLALTLLLSLFIGSRLVKSIAPLIRGIHALAEERSEYVEPKGVLSGLAASINNASLLMQRKNDKLKARDEARSNWISGISHDIRTPLSIMLGYASELEESEAVPPEQRHKAGIIRHQGEMLRSLVSDLNLVSMLEYEMQPLHLKPIRLSALVRLIASEFLNRGWDDKYTLEWIVRDEQLKIYGDEKLLVRALANLVQNSKNYNPNGCHIVLETKGDCEVGSIVVSDDGKGVPAGDIPELLELPYSSKRKRPAQNGHGLGLPMAASIAKAHRGRLIVTSDSGEGFHAEMVLPILRN